MQYLMKYLIPQLMNYLMQYLKKCAVPVLVLLACNAHADKYQIDSSHSRMGFKIRHLGISSVTGQFKKFSGEGNYDPQSGKISDLAVKIEADSIDTNEPDRDKHLRSDDFFDVKKFPTLTFKSKKVEYDGKTPTAIYGDLTIHGKTQSVKLDVDWGGVAVDPWGNQKLAFEAKGKIDRTKFGLTWNKPLKKVAGLLVGNDVTLLIEVEADKAE